MKITRQTIFSIEKRKFVPSALLALKIAQCLGITGGGLGLIFTIHLINIRIPN